MPDADPQVEQNVRRRAPWVGLGIVVLFVVLGVLIYRNTAAGTWSYQWWGILAVALLFVLASAFAGRYWPISLVEGEDGRLSISKAQVAIWTAAVGYSYVTLYAARALSAHDLRPIDSIPMNVLIALGLSAATAVGAKAITVSQIGNNQIRKTDKPGPAGLGDLVAGDNARPDLTKVQLLFWTFVSVAVYVTLTNGALAHYLGSLDCTAHPDLHPVLPQPDINCLRIPDIDTTLMVLMGLSQGTYLGGKLTQANLPRILSATPMSGPPGTTVVLQGADLGTTTGTLYLDGIAYWDGTPVWDDTKISFVWPAKDATGQAWATGTSVAITVVSGGQQANGAPAFTVRAPTLVT